MGTHLAFQRSTMKTACLALLAISSDSILEDVEAVTQSQMKPNTRLDAGFDWEDYQSHDDINAFIEGLAASNSEWISIKSIGQSHEGRDMKVIEITKAGPGKPIAWIEAGI